jgi:hypothetical protein
MLVPKNLKVLLIRDRSVPKMRYLSLGHLYCAIRKPKFSLKKALGKVDICGSAAELLVRKFYRPARRTYRLDPDSPLFF